MALPGLNLEAPVVEEQASIYQDLPANSEWRFEIVNGQDVVVQVVSGLAELFGTELAVGQNYTFNGCKAAIYTWQGCQLKITGECQSDYTAEETPMSSYANVHFALEDMRNAAIQTGSQGPRVLVIGPENAGKTTLVKILSSYATRMGRQPIVVNTDPKEGLLTVPSTLSTVVLDSVMDVEQGWGTSPTNGPSVIPVKLPLVYYYGLEEPIGNTDYFKPLLTRLALSVTNRMEDDPLAKQAGCIVDTAGSITQGKEGYDLIQHMVAEFSVNLLIILGSERLYSDMSRRFSKPATPNAEPVNVVKLDKSGGCVDRDKQYLQQMRLNQIREYFFGDVKNNLSPHTTQLDFSEVAIFRHSEKDDLLDALLPGGEPDAFTKKSIFDIVHPSNQLQRCVLAIMQAEPGDSQEDIRDASVIGFVYIAEVDEKKKKLRILSPMSGRIPRKAMIWGPWPETAGELVG
ncbi:Cleavage polyadenylation factor subunit clp1 [Agyrium rufum]|nr:Cleavage polyadenylation factor subunit clp1 [Agyrium rufum]